MQHFLEKLNFYADVSSRIVKGEKINPRDYNPILIQDLKDLATRMYTGFFTPLEPQALIKEPHWTDAQVAQMGWTTSHPRMGGLAKEAKELLAVNPGAYVAGNMAVGRSVTALSGRIGSPIPSVLTKGDFVALAEATAEIKYRLASGLSHKKKEDFPPLVIQNRQFWGKLFTMEPVLMQDLKKLGIFFSNGPEETKKILEKNWGKTKTQPSTISTYTVKKPNNIFASTDLIKTGQNAMAQSSYDGNFEVAHAKLGPSLIPIEDTKSYAGNALVKMVALMRLSLERLRGRETNNEILSVHDGGVSAFLMNEKGERYTQIFTDKEFFPTSAEFMNEILAGPGVELAELYKSSTSFKPTMSAFHAKIDHVRQTNPAFAKSELWGMDTAVQMAIPAKEFFELYDKYKTIHPHLTEEEICEGIALSHAAIVGEVQRVNWLREPQYNSAPLSLDTEHYIEAAGYPGKSRAQVPEWIRTGPNATTYHMLMDAMGAERTSGNEGYWREGKINIKIAVPGMLSGTSAKNSSNLGELQSKLYDKDISCRLGTDYWREFRNSNGALKNPKQEFEHAADTHRQNIRKILAAHDYLYIPKDYVPSTEKEKRECLLLLSSAFVQRQVFQPGAPHIIMEKGVVSDWFIDIYKSLKEAGLIGQRFEHVVHLTDGPRESAAVINSLSRMTRPSVRHIPKKQVALKLDEPENFTVAFYCSAMNKNALWKPEVKAYTRFLALSGLDLKLGGGNDGMMQAAADGYLEGLAELVARGEKPKGKLHLIQCDATKTIEGDYHIAEKFKHLAAYIDRRCYSTIEERRYDLQRSQMAVGGPGGKGTFEEIVCELLADDFKEKELKLHLFSQSFTQPDGQIAYVYDYLPRVLNLNHSKVKISHTIGELETVTRDNVVSYEARQREAKVALEAAEKVFASFQLPSLKVA